MKTYFYNVGYHTMEECPYTVLYHNQLYSQEQFRELCADITVEEYNKRHSNDKDSYHDSFEDFYSIVIDRLVDSYGFKRLEETASFDPFGWAKFIPKDDWKSETSDNDDLELIRSKL